jgi:hypothetical protein
MDNQAIDVKIELDEKIRSAREMSDAGFDVEFIRNSLKNKGLPDEEVNYILQRSRVKNRVSGNPQKDFLIGILFIALGVVLTVALPGRVFYGAILYGIYRMVKGFI